MNSLSRCVLNVFRSKTSCLKSAVCVTRVSVQFYSSSSFENTIGPQSPAVEKIQELLKLKPSVAFNLISEYNEFAKMSTDEIVFNYNACIEAGVKKKCLMNNIKVLTAYEIDEKFEILKDLPFDLNEVLPLLLLNVKYLKKFVATNKTENKMEFLCNLFQVKTNK